jgi:hypothetical protein
MIPDIGTTTHPAPAITAVSPATETVPPLILDHFEPKKNGVKEETNGKTATIIIKTIDGQNMIITKVITTTQITSATGTATATTTATAPTKTNSMIVTDQTLGAAFKARP